MEITTLGRDTRERTLSRGNTGNGRRFVWKICEGAADIQRYPGNSGDVQSLLSHHKRQISTVYLAVVDSVGVPLTSCAQRCACARAPRTSPSGWGAPIGGICGRSRVENRTWIFPGVGYEALFSVSLVIYLYVYLNGNNAFSKDM